MEMLHKECCFMGLRWLLFGFVFVPPLNQEDTHFIVL